jgi:Flp pilus assembly protein TadG
MSRSSTVRRHGERGSAAIEAAILAPPLLALIALAVVGGRIQFSGGAIEAAAHDAARAASISRTTADARINAQAAAAATLGQQGLHCVGDPQVYIDTAGFDTPVGQPATVAATVSCTVDFSDLIADGVPGSRTLRASFVSSLDTFRTRAVGFTSRDAPSPVNHSAGGTL